MNLKQIINSCIDLVLYSPDADLNLKSMQDRKDELLINLILNDQIGITIILQSDLVIRIRQLALHLWYADIKDDKQVYVYKYLKKPEIINFIDDNIKSYYDIYEIQLKNYKDSYGGTVWSKDSVPLQHIKIRDNLQKINESI